MWWKWFDSPTECGNKDKGDLMKTMFGYYDSEDELNNVNFSPAQDDNEDKIVYQEVKCISGLWLCKKFLSPK